MFRWMALSIFAASLGISAYRRWQARKLGETIRRAEEPPALIAARALVTLPLFGGVLAYLANPRWMSWSSLPLPEWMQWSGVMLGLLVVPGVYWVLTTLGANVSETVLTKSTHQLVTTGPYQWVRHPLYAIGLLLFASIGFIAANWFILLCTVISAFAIRLAVIPREERELIAKFGEGYRSLQRRTGALLPRLTRARPVQRSDVT
ncbi:MAG TPA: isoprenylcysteine carboxylmethyltransferase family protein [Vicinamibacterales bacterium]|nr:isoprenylcysteine carboxylmethyltransferase family protein [Vicinamibacterales bacterium]